MDSLPSNHLEKSAYIIREKKMKRRKKSKGKISKKKKARGKIKRKIQLKIK